MHRPEVLKFFSDVSACVFCSCFGGGTWCEGREQAEGKESDATVKEDGQGTSQCRVCTEAQCPVSPVTSDRCKWLRGERISAAFMLWIHHLSLLLPPHSLLPYRSSQLFENTRRWWLRWAASFSSTSRAPLAGLWTSRTPLALSAQ